jgi:hypothetical protein
VAVTPHEAREILRARGVRIPSALERVCRTLDRTPEHVRPKVETALAVRLAWQHPELLPFLSAHPDVDLCPAYPNASEDIQSRLALGEKPTQILRGLTAREAHEALTAGMVSAEAWLLRDTPWPRACVRGSEVARWLAACAKDHQRRAALETERAERGPHGEEIHGRLIDRVDEISARDLVRGEKTGVREAFERAAKRRYEQWQKENEKKHEPLAPTPAWYRPIRCARLLMRSAALIAEGKDMQHCVGSYAPYVRSQQSVIVSICVRARDGVYRSTVELDRRTLQIRQHKGYRNSEPHEFCRRALEVCMCRWKEKRKMTKTITIPGVGTAAKIFGAVSMAASKDRECPQMNCVLVRAKDGVLDVVATNGHVLAHYRAPHNELGEGEVLIPLDIAARIAKEGREAPFLEIDPTVKTARLLDVLFSWPEIQAVFPPWERVIPKPHAKKPIPGFGIALEYLVLAGKIFQALEPKGKLKLKAAVYCEVPANKHDPIVMSAQGCPLTFVVMPHRTDRHESREIARVKEMEVQQ